MDIERIIATLEAERNHINRAIASLKEIAFSGAAREPALRNRRSALRRRAGMSPAARKRISKMMKKRWADLRRKAAKSS